jgi:hypothetical protein
MNDPKASDDVSVSGSPGEMRSALFAHLVMQQSSMAMMLMGKTAHPETGQVVRDLEAAKLFIDLLEMLEFKTKGNLDPEEAALLKQSLMSLRMAFVEAVDASPPPPAESRPEKGSPPSGGAPSAKSSDATVPPSPSPGEEEHHKKFTKKY